MLSIENLSLNINGTSILENVCLNVEPGKILGIVGESGSGKSLTALAAMQLLPEGSSATGSIKFQDQEMLDADDELMQDLRGDDLAMIFQEPMTALNPVHTIGDQVAEGMMLHEGLLSQEAEKRTIKLLERVGLPPSRFPLSRYPHELSGGQRQRVMIAMACAQSPDLLIADEPTTALDVTLQAQILRLLRELVDEQNMGLILISHDLAVVAETTDEILVMRNGTVLDHGPTTSILKALKHPYTKQLAKASNHKPTRNLPPVLTSVSEAQGDTPLLRADAITRDYPTKRISLFQKPVPFRAVENVSLKLYPGQSVGLVGESGCGKSSLARILLALDKPTTGSVVQNGSDLTSADPETLRLARRNMQVIFQDPFASFNPRHKVERLVAEPLHLESDVSAEEKHQRVVAALEEVGIGPDALTKYPHEFSGGQRQRIAIARALITRPALIIADEPVSALDVSIRAQVLDLLTELRERLGLTYLFISHDLGVVRAICDEVMVMENGQIVERGTVDVVFDNPQSEAAKRLVEATPNLERALASRLQQKQAVRGKKT